MQKYSKNLIELFYNSQFSGAINGADVIVKNQDDENNEIVKIYLVVRNETLKECSFQAKGSIALYASLTTICKIAKDKQLGEILQITEKDVINELKQLNKQEYREVVFALESFKKAVTTYKKRKTQGTIVERENLKARTLYPSKNITRFGEEEKKVSAIESALAEQQTEVENNRVEIEESPKKTVVKEKTRKSLNKSSNAVPNTSSSVQSTEEVKVDKNVKKLEELINEVKLTEAKKDKLQKPETVEDSELLIVPVGGKKKAKKQEKNNVVIPTKIEVRVVEDETKKPKTTTKKQTKITTTTTKTSKKTDMTVDKVKPVPYLLQPEMQKEVENEVIDEIDSITEQLTNAISQLNFTFEDDDNN